MAHAESVKKYSVGDSPEIALWGDSDLPERTEANTRFLRHKPKAPFGFLRAFASRINPLGVSVLLRA